MDMPMSYHVGCNAGILSKTHDKANQYHTDIKDCFVDNTE